MEEKKEEEKKEIVPADWLAADQHTIEYLGKDTDNPRLKINIPANKMLIEITETDPPIMIVACRAISPVTVKGALAHAADIYLTQFEAKANAQTDLTRGVSGAMAKLKEGVH